MRGPHPALPPWLRRIARLAGAGILCALAACSDAPGAGEATLCDETTLTG